MTFRFGHSAALATLATVLVTAGGASAQMNAPADATAELQTPQDRSVGEVRLYQMANGVLVKAHLQGMPQGTHAFHVHTTGECEPRFDAAGGHFNPTNTEHGFDNPSGPHLGDLPNIHVPGSGMLEFDAFLYDVNLESGQNVLADADGAAIMIHEGADDYETDPAGDAGSRIACGVIEMN